jgi:hypothetical protein
VVLNAGANSMDFGTLREGDADGNNCVNILDFSILRSNYGQAGTNADFNQDGWVSILDFSLLRSSFATCGDIVVP